MRKAAIIIHGCNYEVCGFDFENAYGDIGKDYIEVHHIRPLNRVGEEMIVDPKADLCCLCSNCHRMIHRKKNKVISIEELRSMLLQICNKENGKLMYLCVKIHSVKWFFEIFIG